MKALSRARTPINVLSARFKGMAFEGAWRESFGCPELRGSWLIWGSSGNGKTRFVLQLCKYLCGFGKVAYNSLEEGMSLSIQKAFKEVGMDCVQGRFLLLEGEGMSTLRERLRKRKSPDVIAIDSLQYAQMKYKEYKALRAEFPRKLFLLISHAEGKEPAGRLARSIRYDAFVKVRVEGYKAFAMSRYGDGGDKPFIIWPEGAAQYWGEGEEE